MPPPSCVPKEAGCADEAGNEKKYWFFRVDCPGTSDNIAPLKSHATTVALETDQLATQTSLGHPSEFRANANTLELPSLFPRCLTTTQSPAAAPLPLLSHPR